MDLIDKDQEQREKLWDLRGKLIDIFMKYLEGVESGEITPRGAMITALRSFLVDNGVTAVNKPKEIIDALTFLDDLEDLPDFDKEGIGPPEYTN